MIFPDLTRPIAPADVLKVELTKTNRGQLSTWGFDIFDQRTGERVDGGHGFHYEATRDEALNIALRRVLGLRPMRGKGPACVEAERWCDRHWGPRRSEARAP